MAAAVEGVTAGPEDVAAGAEGVATGLLCWTCPVVPRELDAVEADGIGRADATPAVFGEGRLGWGLSGVSGLTATDDEAGAAGVCIPQAFCEVDASGDAVTMVGIDCAVVVAGGVTMIGGFGIS